MRVVRIAGRNMADLDLVFFFGAVDHAVAVRIVILHAAAADAGLSLVRIARAEVGGGRRR